TAVAAVTAETFGVSRQCANEIIVERKAIGCEFDGRFDDQFPWQFAGLLMCSPKTHWRAGDSDDEPAVSRFLLVDVSGGVEEHRRRGGFWRHLTKIDGEDFFGCSIASDDETA